MTTDIVIVGAGGQGRECLLIAEAMVEAGSNLTIRGFYDDSPSQHGIEAVEALGYPLLGTFEDLLAETPNLQVCLGVGDGRIRQRLDQRLRAHGFQSPILIHPGATLGRPIELQAGTVIWAGARLSTNISIGRHVHLNQNATVGHDAYLRDYVTVNPLAAVSGNTTIDTLATLGAGSVVLQGLEIGSGSVVGAGACVTRNVPGTTIVKGVPAR